MEERKKETGYFEGFGNGYIPKIGEKFEGYDGVADETISVQTMTPTPGGNSLEELYRRAVENAATNEKVTIENGSVIIRRERSR